MRTKRDLSITSLAKELNVSVATISRVVNNQQGVSESLRKRVRKAIDAKGYRPSTVINRQKHIAVISQMDDFVIENFLSQILAGVENYGYEQDVATSVIFVKSIDSQRHDLLKMLRDRHCDGALSIFNSSFDDEQISDVIQGGICTMLVSSRREIEGAGYIDIDSYAGGYVAAKHLLDLGHTEIVFLAGPTLRNFDNQERVRAFSDAVADSSADVHAITINHAPTRLTQEAGYNQMLEALDRNPRLSAVFANNDEMAHGAIRACVERGRRVPEDISFIGFDDCPFSQFSNPPLTTVRQPLVEMGYEAIKMVDLKLKGVINELPRKIVQGELIERKSTCPFNTSE